MLSSRQRPPNSNVNSRVANDNDKERRKSHLPPPPGGASAAVHDLEDVFPVLKRLSSSRSVIPILVIISLVCGLLISTMLVGSSTSGLEIPQPFKGVPKTVNATSVTAAPQGAQTSQLDTKENADASDTSVVPRKLEQPNQRTSDSEPYHLPLKRTTHSEREAERPLAERERDTTPSDVDASGGDSRRGGSPAPDETTASPGTAEAQHVTVPPAKVEEHSSGHSGPHGEAEGSRAGSNTSEPYQETNSSLSPAMGERGGVQEDASRAASHHQVPSDVDIPSDPPTTHFIIEPPTEEPSVQQVPSSSSGGAHIVPKARRSKKLLPLFPEDELPSSTARIGEVSRSPQTAGPTVGMEHHSTAASSAQLDKAPLNAVVPPPTLVSEFPHLKGLYDVPYNATINGSETVSHLRAFPVAKGVYLFVTPLPGRGREHAYARSRFGCLCVDSTSSRTNTESIERLLVPLENVTDNDTLASASPDSGERQQNSSSAATPLTVRIAERDILQYGRHAITLQDGRQLETRVLPCTGTFYASTPVALCDPRMTPQDDEEEETPSPTTAAPAGLIRRKPSRPPPKPAMIPIGSCSALESIILADVLEKKLFVPPTPQIREALVQLMRQPYAPNQTFIVIPANAPPSPTEADETPKWDFALRSADLEASAEMCSQCAVGGTVDLSLNPFSNSNRFRAFLFEKKTNGRLVTALKSVARTRWKAVRDLLDFAQPSVEATQGGHQAHIQQAVSLPPIASSGSSDPNSAAVSRGLRSIEAFAGRCDRRHRSEHFAQCFAPQTSTRKSGNWSTVAEDRHHRNPLLLRRSSFFEALDSSFPIPSRLALHPVNVGGHIVCYASGDMVCDIVGRTGGWEAELINIVAFAATELRKLTRRAAALLHQREQAKLAADVTGSSVAAEPTSRVASDRRVDEFALTHAIDSNNLAPLIYQRDDVAFIDVGGNVGVFAVNMWKRGFRTEVFEALPQNVFLLEASRCTNQAEEFASWEEHRSQRLRRLIKVVEQEFGEELRVNLTNTTNASDIVSAYLAENKEHIRTSAESRLPLFYQDNIPATSNQDPRRPFNGPVTPRFEVHHVALGNGKRGRSGDEVLPFELNERLSESSNDETVAESIIASAQAITRGESADDNSMCVMISEKQNFGDIVILCNETLVEQANRSLAEVGPLRARVLNDYLPRGFIQLRSLDRVLDDPAEDISFDNTAMMKRFAESFSGHLGEQVAHSTSNDSAAVFAPSDNSPSRKPSVAKIISEATATTELRDFLRYSQIVMKIDVEGNEEYVMQGADKLLSDPFRRPKLILSEVWRKTNIARYGAFMVTLHGYVGFALADRIWMRSAVDVLRYHRTMPREMDTIVWVLPGYERLIPPSALARRSP